MRALLRFVPYLLTGLMGLTGVGLLLDSYGVRGSFEKGAEGDFDGRFITARNDIRVRSPREISWSTAGKQTGVNFGDQVFVGADSEAIVDLRVLKVELGENSLLRIEKTNETPLIQLDTGEMSVRLQKDKRVSLSIGGESVNATGTNKNSELFVKKTKVGNKERIGISFVNGRTELTGADGKKISGREGRAVVLESVDGGPTIVKKYLLLGVSPNKNLYMGGQKIPFKWQVEGELDSVVLEVAKDHLFKERITKAQVENKVDFEITAPGEPGDYFWRLKGTDKEGMTLISPTLRFDIVEFRAIKILDPFYHFVRPRVWTIDVVLETIPLANEYHIEIATDDKFQHPVKVGDDASPAQSFTFEQWGTVFLRARYRYEGVPRLPEWSQTVSLVIPGPLPVPKPAYEGPFLLTELRIAWPELKGVDAVRLQTSLSPA